MSDMWKKWEGQVADHKYQLQHYLGSTDHSVVFLAEFHDPQPRQATIKFISADVSDRNQQIAAWKNAAQLRHPNLIQIYGAGLCKIEDTELLYVAMEYAEENLAQVLPHRALRAEEAKEMLNAVADALVYLHGKNMTHGHVRPSNILATNEVLKLSCDTIFPAGESREMRRERSAYDAPELPDSPYTPAADIWSLGVTLVEAFTQQPTVLPFDEQADPIVPPAIRDPFLEIARHTLQREPRLRWTSAKIAERLNSAVAAARSVAAGAGATTHSAVASVTPAVAGTASVSAPPPVVSPVDVPLSKEPAIPLSKQPPTPAKRAAISTPAPPETAVLPNYVIPLFAVFLVMIALILLPFVLRHRTGPQASTVQPSASANAPNVAATTSANVQPAPKLPPAKYVTPPTAASPTHAQPLTPAAPATTSRDTEAPLSPAQTKSNAPQGRGEALDQVKPEVSAKALATIQGTVRVVVNVHVDAAGNVTEATLDNAGPSRYFADLALKAARQWVFTSPEVNGRSVPSDWRIQFAFTQAGANATANQFQP